MTDVNVRPAIPSDLPRLGGVVDEALHLDLAPLHLGLHREPLATTPRGLAGRGHGLRRRGG